MTDLKRIAYRLEHAAGVYRDNDDEAAADRCMEYAAELLSAPDDHSLGSSDNDLLSNPRAHDPGGHYPEPGCMWCGHGNLWFSRTFEDLGNGDSMHYYCSECHRPQLNKTELSYWWDHFPTLDERLPPSDDDGKKVTHNDTNHPGYLVVVAPSVATLSFDMTTPDGRRMHRDALQGEACRLALWEMDQYLRNRIKYSGFEKEIREAPMEMVSGAVDIFVGEMVRKELRRICDDHGIRLDED